MAQVKVNREYKDRLFRLLFGDAGNKENLLSLYNAINMTSYTNTEELEIVTLDDVIYMKMKNDVALIIHNSLALYEQQSTFNKNMPLRGFLYFGKLYDKFVETNNLNIYGSKLIKIPTPQYIVFYNGNDNCDDITKLKLSAAFEDSSKASEFEWTATMININYGRNKALMERCKILKDYTIFVDRVKRYHKQTKSLEEALNRAVNECISEDILADFLKGHKAEVIDVCLTEYDEEKVMLALREEYKEIGLEMGMEIGEKSGQERINKLFKKLRDENRIDDLMRSLDDAEFQKELLKEYDI